MSDTMTETKPTVDELNARAVELEAELVALRAQITEAEAEPAPEPEPEPAPERMAEYTLELATVNPFVMDGVTLIKGDQVLASQMAAAVGERLFERYLMMGWFKVLDGDLPPSPYANDNLNLDVASTIATGRPFLPFVPEIRLEPIFDDFVVVEPESDGEQAGERDGSDFVDAGEPGLQGAESSNGEATIEPGPATGSPAAGDDSVNVVVPTPESVESPGADDDFVDAGEVPGAPVVVWPGAEWLAEATIPSVKDWFATLPAETVASVAPVALEAERAGRDRSTLVSWLEEMQG